MDIIFATSNSHKLNEARGIIGDSFSLVTPLELGITDDIPEEEETLEGNALSKAQYLWNRCGRGCFADDTGLEVEALGGAPGVRSARYASDECDSRRNMQKLIKELNGIQNRKARFRTVVALIIDGKVTLFEGELNGSITETPSGSGGFGYDPIFLPDGYTKTLAELTSAEKNIISHRGIAMRKLSDFLKSML
ncbi:MAG: non-canonical purine NTP pyrophosphatase, RdgB/HAM1 family [Bacteroidetes bacterium HGW-Bacteroidetes-5]|jgi:XTP/dITP diphosphohydrolase|nr:MAG: non-canonical purine NTP pyrophosphatase, RdgB/HAM1 family [Bacteroidetes bacterium HGW-Bacteroidetes-5]